jgi:hypothetical protein
MHTDPALRMSVPVRGPTSTTWHFVMVPARLQANATVNVKLGFKSLLDAMIFPGMRRVLIIVTPRTTTAKPSILSHYFHLPFGAANLPA